MTSYKGLIYVKHGRVGTRSEGPDYYLQTVSGDHLLRYQARHPWAPDYQLEFYVRRMVEVTGTLNVDGTLQADAVTEILSPHLPQ